MPATVAALPCCWWPSGKPPGGDDWAAAGKARRKRANQHPSPSRSAFRWRPGDWSGLSLAVGVSVAESLDPSNAVGLALKWPNDLWVGDRKLGGILIETALLHPDTPERYLVIGIGINIGPREATGLNTAPAWIQEWRPHATAPEVLREIVVPLVHGVQLFDERGFVPFAPRFAARDILRGREVRLSDGTEGRCEGVGWGGELLVQTADGMKTVTSAEVSVRPVRSAQ